MFNSLNPPADIDLKIPTWEIVEAKLSNNPTLGIFEKVLINLQKLIKVEFQEFDKELKRLKKDAHKV